MTEGKARRSLVRRVAAANDLPANLFLSIHHDSVPNKFLEDWEFEGKKSHFSDRFSGYSVFVSRDNPDFKTSLSFAELLAKEMKAQGLEYAEQYSQPIMGQYQHPLLNKETGVYSYDELDRAEKDHGWPRCCWRRARSSTATKSSRWTRPNAATSSAAVSPRP